MTHKDLRTSSFRLDRNRLSGSETLIGVLFLKVLNEKGPFLYIFSLSIASALRPLFVVLVCFNQSP